VKLALTKRLYEKGFDRKAVINFYRFIDWLIGLPKPLELEYLNDVHKLEESTKMAYISSVERFGMEKGIKQGIEKDKLEVAQHMLEEGLKVTLIKKTTGLSLQKIKKLQQELKNKKN